MPSMESFAARQPRQMMLLLGPSALISMGRRPGGRSFLETTQSSDRSHIRATRRSDTENGDKLVRHRPKVSNIILNETS